MAKTQTQTGATAIRALFKDAGVIDEDGKASAGEDQAERWRHDPLLLDDPNVARRGVKPGQWPGFPFSQMPPDCPVEVIGRQGRTVYCLTPTRHLRAMEKWDQPGLADLFAPCINFAAWAFPAFGQKKQIVFGSDGKPMTDGEGEVVEDYLVKRLEVQKLATCLIQQAARTGDFNPNKQLRGRCGWEDESGRFIWHSGDWLWMAVKQGKTTKLSKVRPQQHEKFLYTRQHGFIRPWRESVSHAESPAQRILAELKTWNWERPYLDPILVLGWLMTAFMSGALKVRPIIFTTGGRGVGKSMLHQLVNLTLADLVESIEEVTAAFIYQTVGHDALPVLVDELESTPGSMKEGNIIKLARICYSGGKLGRGGADGVPSDFTLKSPMMFSGINPPPMTEADVSRMAVLNLNKLEMQAGSKRKVVDIMRDDGRMLLRQVMDGWENFNASILPYWWSVLQDQRMDARAIDTYGTLLAAAELAVGQEALADAGLPVGDPQQLGSIINEATRLERAENLENWHKCLNILFQSQIEAWKEGVKPTIGSVCEHLRVGEWDQKGAAEKLNLVNLGCKDAANPLTHSPLLCIPKEGPALSRIFDRTVFQQSVWFSALKQAPKNIVIRDAGNGQKVKINGSTVHCLLVDLKAFEEFSAGRGHDDGG